MPKFKALYATDKMNYNAILDDGSFVKLLWKGDEKYEVWPMTVTDKRPPVEAVSYSPPKNPLPPRAR